MQKNNTNLFVYILIRSWKAFDNFDRCIDSVYSQGYKHYKILFVDDASGYSNKQKVYIKNKLKNHVTVFNKIRKYSLRNAYELIYKYANDEKNAIIFNLDGDDWLPNKNCIQTVIDIYSQKSEVLLTYGECYIWDGKKISKKTSRYLIENVNIPYKKNIIRTKTFRNHPFLPLHPRTWKVSLFKKIKLKDFKRNDKTWIKFAEDQAIFYPMLEMANGNIAVIKKPLYVYNQSSKYTDTKVNLNSLLKDEVIIRRKKKYEKI